MKIEIKWNKDTISVELADDATLKDLKDHLTAKTGVTQTMQKLMGKPKLNGNPEAFEAATQLSTLGVKDGGKLMLIGSPTQAVVEATSKPKEAETKRKEQVANFPVPFWVLPPYAALLAEPYVESKLDGGDAATALTVMDFLLSRINALGLNVNLVRHLKEATEAYNHPMLTIVPEDRVRLMKVHALVRKCCEFTQETMKITKPEEVAPVVDQVLAMIKGVTGPEDWLLLPYGWIGMQNRCTMYLMITKGKDTKDGGYTVVVVNTGDGLEYHPSTVSDDAKKIRYKTCLRFENVTEEKLLDKAWWLTSLSLWMKSNDGQTVSEYHRVEVVYDVLLPWLVDSAPQSDAFKAEVNAANVSLHATGVPYQTLGGAIYPPLAETTPTSADPHASFETPQRSEASAARGLLSAMSYFLAVLGMPKPVVEQIKFVIRYETFLRGAEELFLAAQRCDPTPSLTASLTRLGKCGVDPGKFNISLDKMFEAMGPKEFVKTSKTNTIVSRSFFTGKVVALYFSGSWCPACKKTTPLLVEAYDAVRNRLAAEAEKKQSQSQATDANGKVAGIQSSLVAKEILAGKKTPTPTTAGGGPVAPLGFEVIWCSVDRKMEDHDAMVEKLPPTFCRTSFPEATKNVVEAFNISGVPTLMLFGPDGMLITDKGVEALRKDPEARRFPNAPWTGAKMFTHTDRALLSISGGQLSHEALKQAGGDDENDKDAILNNTHLGKIQSLVLAVKSLSKAMPSELPPLEDEEEEDEVKTAGDSKVAVAGGGGGAADSVPEPVKTKVTMPLEGFDNTDLLPTVSTSKYEGKVFDSKLPSLGDLSAFKVPTSIPELAKMMKFGVTTVEQLWDRARFSGTSSRVAIQLQIIEFTTWFFTNIIPVPKSKAATKVDKTAEGAETKAPAAPHCIYVEAFPKVPDAAPAAGNAGGGAAADDDMPEDPRQADAEAQRKKDDQDMQYQLLRQVYGLMLSLITAWQSVEVPTRAFDAERGLVAMLMLSCFDAVARNTQNASKCFMLAFLLNDDLGYHLSTTVGKNTKKFVDVSATMELCRPILLVRRAEVLEYIKGNEATFKNELFDFRMPDKFEVRKYSNTVTFLRKFCENCGYELVPRPQPGRPVMQQSEMEVMMAWLTDERTPLAQQHPEFKMTRDMVLLTKFLFSMEMRDSQLFSKKKQLDEFATWRISFDEDGPGRQMSAGWRTKPRPPRWELMLVRGRDMDIADIEVKGFGERELSYGEGMVMNSPIDVSSMLNLEYPTEDDVLHATKLPTFGDVLSQEEAEVLLSCLTTSYVRIPLVLEFFATQDHHSYLFSSQLQGVLRAALFEPGTYVSKTAIQDIVAKAQAGGEDAAVVKVPMRLTAKQKQEADLVRLHGAAVSAAVSRDDSVLLGASTGLLLNELKHSPAGVLRPLEKLLHTITELGPSSVYSMNASYVLFLAQLTCDVLQFVSFAIKEQREVVALLSEEERLNGFEGRNFQCLVSYKDSLCATLVKLVKPLLQDQWRNEAEANNDTPSMCVIHTYLALLHRSLLCCMQLNADAKAKEEPWSPEDHAALLQSCAFVRSRHGFGLGTQRTQLAMAESDASMSPEQRLLRFLQAQGLDTKRITQEQLEHGRRLMMSGGRRRAVFVQVQSRYYNDTVRVPNLQRTDPKSTTEAKSLKLPPCDVPENVLFGLLQDHHAEISAHLSEASPVHLDGTLQAVVSTVLKDREQEQLRQQEAQAVAGGSPGTAQEARWSLKESGVYTAKSTGLIFHLQTCELFWRNDELKPVPDSMSHFSDYETILGKEVMQCGLVKRTQHKHWVHVVGTEYDLVEWDAPSAYDQGMHQPHADNREACAKCGNIGDGCWYCDKCSAIVCRHSRCYACKSKRPDGAAAVVGGKDKKKPKPKAKPSMKPSATGAAQADDDDDEQDDAITDVTFNYQRFNRPIDIYDETPWPVRSERWAVDAVIKVLRNAYPLPGEMKFSPLMAYRADQEKPEGDATPPPASPNTAGSNHQKKKAVEERSPDVIRLVMNDEAQYEDEVERNTWKELVVSRTMSLEKLQAPKIKLDLFNLVPHARKMWRSMVYSSDQRSCLHSLNFSTLAKRERGVDDLPFLKYHAGEIKKRIHNESSLQIVRFNADLCGREAYVPARLLQGLIPSALLENFLFWQGAKAGGSIGEELIRGYPMGSHPWYNYPIEISVTTPAESATMPTSPTLMMLPPKPIVQIRRCTNGGYTNIGDKTKASLLARTASSLAPPEVDMSKVTEAAMEELFQMFPHLSEQVRRYALAKKRNDVNDAAAWTCEEVNQDLIAQLQHSASPASMVRQNTRGDSPTSPGSSPSRTGFPSSIDRIGSHDSLLGAAENAIDQTEAEALEEPPEEDLFLLNFYQHHGKYSAQVRQYADMLSSIEDASHILVWGKKHPFHDELEIHLIELPRLRAKFQPKVDPTSGNDAVQLYLVDHPGWRVSTDTKMLELVAPLTEPLDQCIVLQGASIGEVSLMVPSHTFSKMKIKGDPFNPSLSFDRGSLNWQEAVPSPFYMYTVHTSRCFLVPPSLAATLYMTTLLAAKQRYTQSFPFIEACYVDTPFSAEEQFMFNLSEQTLDPNAPDNHPDAHAIRLKLSHSVMHSSNKEKWRLHIEISKYFSKLNHVSGSCRLQSNELLDLMKRASHGMPIIKVQLEYWRAIAEGRTDVVLKPPQPTKAGQPWAKLVCTPQNALQQSKLTRIQFKLPKAPFVDAETVKLLWEDTLMLDEESGTNRQLGWFFLYLIKSKKMKIMLGDTDIAASFGSIMARFFHLKLARWGKEAQESGESEVTPSYSMGILAAMEYFPEASWPYLTDRRTLAQLERGLNVNATAEQQQHFSPFEDPGDRQRETELPGFMRKVDTVWRELHRASYRAVAQIVKRQLTAVASSGQEDPRCARRVANPTANIVGRVMPENTSQESLLLTPHDDATKKQYLAFSRTPLDQVNLEEFVQSRQKNVGASGVTGHSSELPFDVKGHPMAQSFVAKDMLNRLEGDMGVYADQCNTAIVNTLKCLSPNADTVKQLMSTPGSEVATISQLDVLTASLKELHSEDSAFVSTTVDQVVKLANDIHQDGSGVVDRNLLIHSLNRIKGTRSPVSLEWLCGAILSTTFGETLQTVNPYHGGADKIVQLVLRVMLHTNRMHFASQAMTFVRGLKHFLGTVSKFREQTALSETGMGQRSSSVDAVFSASDEATLHAQVKQRLEQLCTQLLDGLTAQRYYVDGSAAGGYTFDPRYLAFEFIFSILLRKRQVEMVRWFVDSIRNKNESRVQQMIMGQGKTTVVGPLLALILADGKTLVTQVMPTALLEQSRNVLRKCFTVVIPKHVLTLQFDRSFEDSPTAVEVLAEKLHSALKERAIVVAAPECLKALMLKFVEQLHAVEQVKTEDITDLTTQTSNSVLFGNVSRRAKEKQILKAKTLVRSSMADAIVPIFEMWRDGVLIMDEVDVLLHPLRSELNFPIGYKHPIDLSGPRWLLPLALLDAMFFPSRHHCCDLKPQGALGNRQDKHEVEADKEEATRLLDAVTAAVERGFACHALQREPHAVLLDTGFYFDDLHRPLTHWLIRWLRVNLPARPVAEDGTSYPKQYADVDSDFFYQFLTEADAVPFADAVTTKYKFPTDAIQILNLARDWITMLLPHVLSKIDRVGYGMLSPDDLALAQLNGSANMPLSRRLMAVPFVAKDVPSRSSEFAHPDVVVGLTILAYRYEGLRQSDIKDVLLQLKQDYSRQAGPQEQRPASLLYNHWASLARRDIEASGGTGYSPARTRTSSSLGGLAVEDPNASKLSLGHEEEKNSGKFSGVIPLSQLQVLDSIQLTQLYHQLHRLPEVVHHYLCNHVFPRTMNYQRLKVSACGHELGSNILFQRRIGFSGTPSNLLPRDLGECSYEPGSDGKIISVLSDEKVTSAERLPLDWNPRMLLERIAAAHPPYHALIDTGALITNMDNHQVATFLIERIAPQFEGVVYLDNQDRQMVLLRNNGLIVPVSQCGISLARRFTFFDQIHTTGIDIKQSPNAVAVVTIGKDMVFRDYAQGCFRMRGIGKGQRIHTYLIPEVVRRMVDTLQPYQSEGDRSKRSAVIQIPAWLLLNAMRVEGLQFAKLQQQELANAYRKVAFRELVGNVIDSTILSRGTKKRVPKETEFQRSRRFVGDDPAKKGAVLRHSIEEYREIIEFVVPGVIEAPPPFIVKVKKLIAEKHIKLTPELEVIVASVLERIAHSTSAVAAPTGDAGSDGRKMETLLGYNAEVVHEQEAEEEQEQEAEQEEQRVSAFTRDDEEHIPWHIQSLMEFRSESDKAETTAGGGDGKEVAEADCAFYPCSRFQVRPQQPRLTNLPQSLSLSDNFFKARWSEGQHLGDRRLKNCILFIEWLTTGATTTGSSAATTSAVAGAEANLQQERRYFGVVSLAEGETIRWMIHHRMAAGVKDTPLSLRSVVSGATLDTVTPSGVVVGSSGNTASTMDAPTLWYRFLNNDMFYDPAELRVLEKVVFSSIPLHHRLAFFTECLRLRRRHRNSWEDAPIARLFTTADQEAALAALPTFKKLCACIEQLHREDEQNVKQMREEGQSTEDHIPLLDRFGAAFKGAATKAPQPEGEPEYSMDLVEASKLLGTALPLPMGRFTATDLLEAVRYITIAQQTGGSQVESESQGQQARHITWTIVVASIPTLAAYFTPPPPPQATAADSGQSMMEALQQALGYWACEACTSHNELSAKMCSICGTPNAATAGKEDDQPWLCSQCTFRNQPTSSNCEVCGFDSGRKGAGGGNSGLPTITAPEGFWVCQPDKGGCSKFNPDAMFYCEVCDKARPDLAAIRF